MMNYAHPSTQIIFNSKESWVQCHQTAHLVRVYPVLLYGVNCHKRSIVAGVTLRFHSLQAELMNMILALGNGCR